MEKKPKQGIIVIRKVIRLSLIHIYTRAIEKGMLIEQVQKILGHEQIDTTLRYAMVNQNNVKLSHCLLYTS